MTAPAASRRSCEAAATLSRRRKRILSKCDKEPRTRSLVNRSGVLTLDTLTLLASSRTYQRFCIVLSPFSSLTSAYAMSHWPSLINPPESVALMHWLDHTNNRVYCTST